MGGGQSILIDCNYIILSNVLWNFDLKFIHCPHYISIFIRKYVMLVDQKDKVTGDKVKDHRIEKKIMIHFL